MKLCRKFVTSWDLQHIFNNNFGIALKGIIVFLGIIFCIAILDEIIKSLFLDELTSKETGITLRHFSWHIKDIVSKDAMNNFLNSITLNKSGFMSKQWFYVVIIALYIVITIIAYFYFTADAGSGNKIDIKKGHSFFSLNRVPVFFLVIISWLFLKQLVYVFVIPPLQTPDETFHYFYTAAFNAENETIDEIRNDIKKNSEIYEFSKYSEMALPHTYDSSNIAGMRNSQTQFYYFIVNKIAISYLSIKNIPGIIYCGRTLSSIAMIVSIILIYFISLRIFIGPQKILLAQLSTAFAATLPQFSYVGASMGPDSMVTMFITGSILCMVISMDSIKSIKKFTLFYLMAIILSVFAMSTKSSGFLIPPIILIVGIIICYLRFFVDYKSGLFFGTFFLFSVAGIIFLFVVYDYFSLYSFVNNRIIPFFAPSDDFELFNFRKISIFFVSFWLSYGWMIYKMSIGTYFFLAGITGLMVFGLFKNYQKSLIVLNKNLFMLLLICAVFTSLFMIHPVPQGRYLFGAMSSWAVFFAVGVYGIIPEKYYSNSVKIIIGNLLLFNMLIVFGLLIPVFYLT